MKKHYILVEIEDEHYGDKDFSEALEVTNEILLDFADYIAEEFNTNKSKSILAAAVFIRRTKDQVEEDLEAKEAVKWIIEELTDDTN